MRLGLVNRNVADLSVMPAGLREKSERRALTIDDLNRMCGAATGTTAILVDLIGRNGLRPSEARAMRWEFIDREALTMTVRTQLSNKAEFLEPKSRKAHRMSPVQRHNLARSIRVLCVRLEIATPITPYELRHTAISIQAKVGYPAFQIADWAGTSKRMISDVYRHQLDRLTPPPPVQLKVVECSLNLVPRSVGVLIAPTGQGQHHHDQTTQTAFA